MEFQNTIQFAPSLAKVEINFFKFLGEDTIKSILLGCIAVKYLSFYPNHAVPVEKRLDVLYYYQNSLVELDLYIDDSYILPSNCSITFFGILSNMVNLKVLTMRGDVSSQFVRNDPFKKGWNSLESLDISGFNVRYDTSDNHQVPNSWQNFVLLMLENQAQTLKKLSLPQVLFDHSTVGVFADKFVSSKIENIKIGETCLLAVKNLACLKTLHVVGLSSRNLDFLRLTCLSSALRYSSVFDWISHTPQFLSIKELTVENVLEDERNLILKLINACKSLESLAIFSGCNTPTQLSYIISRLPSLKKLNIHRMPCLRSRHLEQISSHLPNLVILNLRYNTLTDGILQYYCDHVQSKLPNLQLVCDWGYWNLRGGQPWVIDRENYNKSPMKTKIAPPQTLMLEHDDHCAPSSSCNLLPDERAKIREILNTVNDYEDDD